MNGDQQLTAEEAAAILATPEGQAALALCAECGVRISWLAHLRRGCRHYTPPSGGRVCAYQKKRQPPEGWPPTAVQARLDALLAGALQVAFEERPVPVGDTGPGH